MTVYVDDSGIRANVHDGETGRNYNTRWCHLFCDGDLDELHRFAAGIGMRRSWFQGQPEHRYPHYDVVPSRRARAVAAGAVEVTWRESLPILKAAFPPEQYRALRGAAKAS